MMKTDIKRKREYSERRYLCNGFNDDGTPCSYRHDTLNQRHQLGDLLVHRGVIVGKKVCGNTIIDTQDDFYQQGNDHSRQTAIEKGKAAAAASIERRYNSIK